MPVKYACMYVMKSLSIKSIFLSLSMLFMMSQALNQTETMQTMNSKPPKSNSTSNTAQTVGLTLIVLSPVFGMLILCIAYFKKKKTQLSIAPESQEDALHAASDDPHQQTAPYYPNVHSQHSFLPMNFIVAAQGGYVGILSDLMQRGADVDQSDANGMTALIHATQRNNIACVNLLIDADADISKADITGKQALDYAQDIQLKDERCYILLRLAQLLKIKASTSEASKIVLEPGDTDDVYILIELANLYRDIQDREVELIQAMRDIANETRWPWVSEQGRLLLKTALMVFSGDGRHAPHHFMSS